MLGQAFHRLCCLQVQTPHASDAARPRATTAEVEYSQPVAPAAQIKIQNHAFGLSLGVPSGPENGRTWRTSSQKRDDAMLVPQTCRGPSTAPRVR